MLCAVFLFEITTHDNRPLHIIFAGAIGHLMADVWQGVITLIHLDCVLKQALYLAPAFLSLSTYFVVQESPLWLIPQENYNAAENVMFEGARLNGYPLPNTACLLKRLWGQTHDIKQDCFSDQKKALDDCPLLRRELIMILSFFSLPICVVRLDFLCNLWKPNVVSVGFLLCYLIGLYSNASLDYQGAAGEGSVALLSLAECNPITAGHCSLPSADDHY
ncbi:hypothetical protein HPB48_022397 [Haemaphysalis longicornis]|uniref:Uncharacterized protein n=1 Tax=Haemaphysalis longicornis TaxID=44386 RepID=A0A9J6FZV9_HAELO|nr:hypothetical protein HPB48_022397 [Haemaphysalis longicornis]